MVLKQSGKWEMIWKNPDSFDTVRKWEMIWKNPDKISGFSVLRTKISGQTKQIPGSNATLFITSARSTDIAAEEVVVSVVPDSY